ncbi:aldehyde dehydrogenase [Mycobacteroides abscessus subsp. abscessus]|uniref:aldehyde dehydrogenase (NADP(+)) n=1 Tax=Brevibacterium casei TaxID=33889 RepID=UPI000925B5F6|nr:aldehyde dehydrogenase (NADP(+)) [Brevibacterium casei]SII60396.1 aldehyde dehydrogenase [Mycobacteroides abscessus subsp. abscessus]
MTAVAIDTPTALDSAVRAAATAAEQNAQADPATRAGWLEAIARELRAAAPELVSIADRETHLGENRLHTELRRTAFQLDLFADEIRRGSTLEATIDHADPDWGMGPRPDIRRMNVPLGVVGVFGASNFPFAFSVIGGDSASALAAGCAVLHKFHSAHTELARRTGQLVVDALASAGAPEGLFSLVEGREAGIAIVEHPLVRAVGFTGSTAVGRELFARAAARPEPIPFFGELGSTNPVFVFPTAWQARGEAILDAFAGSFTAGVGQFCTKPGALLVPEAGTDVADRLGRALSQVSISAMLSPGLRTSYGAAVDAMAQRPGVRVLIDGRSADEVPDPTVFEVDAEEVLADPGILGEEMFGPATLVVRYRDEAQLRRLADVLDGQLTTSIQADAADSATDLVDLLAAASGRVLWNEWPTGVTVSYAQEHGGPYPATTAPGTTSVGTSAIRRFQRPVAYQGFPDAALPPVLQEANPWSVTRRVDGVYVNA